MSIVEEQTIDTMSMPDRRQEKRIDVVRRIVKAWERAGVSVNCELCHHPDWTLIATGDCDGLSIPLRASSSIEMAQFFLVYGVECKKCGNMRLMTKARVEELASGE